MVKKDNWDEYVKLKRSFSSEGDIVEAIFAISVDTDLAAHGDIRASTKGQVMANIDALEKMYQGRIVNLRETADLAYS